MEKQRSFSIKRTRFLVFSLIISFSITFLTFLSIWAIRATPILNQQTHLKPFNVLYSFSSFSRNFSENIVSNVNLSLTHFSRPVNTSSAAKISRFQGLHKKQPDGESQGGEAVNVKFSSSSVNNSDKNVEEFASGKTFKDSEIEGHVRKEFTPELYTGDAVNGNSKSAHHLFDISSENAVISRIGKSHKIEERGGRICDLTKGKWVFDDSYPLYTTALCPFIDEGFNCEANGRLDKDYMSWRWQPQDCNIPRFNATNMLELIRGKRLVFVGDSINRNQWESMLCLLMGGIKDPKRVYESHRRRITKDKGNYCFKFLDYKCTVEYYVSHFLVHESKARIGKKRVQTLRIDTVDKGSSRWKGADILIFNTAHWWSHYKTKSGINYYQEGDKVHPRMDVSMAFQKAMITWASWIEKYINPRKTRVIFRSSAPSHFRGGQWNAGGHCREAFRPLNKTSGMEYPEKTVIVEEIIKGMKTPVSILNVTSLSDYRIDGHPSIYGRRSGKSYSSSDIEDCSHWCLPGVPDTWNQLLYCHLQSRG